jgi:hypothetical protein
MNVNLPASAAFGYYWAVQFEPAQGASAAPGGANVRGAVAIFVLLNADAPGAKRTVDVTGFSVERKSYEFLPVNFRIATHNSGNTHVAPTGNIFIKRGSTQVGVLSINPNGGFVLPGSNRVFETAWGDGFPVYVNRTDASGQLLRDKNGQIKKKLSWDFSHANRLRFGHYSAQLLLVYNDGARDIPVTGSVSFWVVPWRLIIGVLAILIVPPLAVYMIMRRRFRKRLARERQKTSHA